MNVFSVFQGISGAGRCVAGQRDVMKFLITEGVSSFEISRCEVFTAVKIHVQVFWVVTLCSVVGYHCFGGPYCLHLEGEVLGAWKWY
jgi:hypothetical protein